jgi:hypothetical protein
LFTVLLQSRCLDVVRAEKEEHFFFGRDATARCTRIANAAIPTHRVVAIAEHALIRTTKAGALLRNAATSDDVDAERLSSPGNRIYENAGLRLRLRRLAAYLRRVGLAVVVDRAVLECAIFVDVAVEAEDLVADETLIERIGVVEAGVLRLPIVR